MKKKRLSKDDYYLNIAKEVALRSTCFRLQGGAIIVCADQIVSTGYIGAPRKTKDCFSHQICLREKRGIPHGQQYEICRSVHAEMNAIINAARAGVSLLGGDLFIYAEVPKTSKKVDSFPCFICKKIMINAGLNRVICSTKDGGKKIFKIADWTRDWQKKDLLDDKYQYGKDRKPTE